MPFGYVPGLGKAQDDFRIKHIARCMLHGRTLEQIEPKLCRPNDSRDYWVRKQAEKIVTKVLEAQMQKLYVLVRTDLPKNYQAVQAGHAVAAFMIDYPNTWRNEILVYLKTKDEDDINTWNQCFAEWGCKQSRFQEPDLDNEVTVIAVLSDSNSDMLLRDMVLV